MLRSIRGGFDSSQLYIESASITAPVTNTFSLNEHELRHQTAPDPAAEARAARAAALR